LEGEGVRAVRTAHVDAPTIEQNVGVDNEWNVDGRQVNKMSGVVDRNKMSACRHLNKIVVVDNE
jgi:hypothetical protein